MTKTRTSQSHPIEVDFVDSPFLPPGAHLGLTFAPGKVQPNASSGSWARDLEADLRRLREHHGVDVLVSLIEPHEYEELGISALGEMAATLGLERLELAIADVSVPVGEAAFGRLIEEIVLRLGGGRSAVVHCKGGLGRSGLVAAAALVHLGAAPRAGIAQVRAARPGAIETAEQERYVERYVAAPSSG